MSNPPRPAKIYRSTCRKFAACVTAVTLFALCLFAPTQPSARAQTTVGSMGLVISQVYTRGGEPGAAFQNDYAEVFNRGTSSVDMNNWSLHLSTGSGPIPPSITINFVSSRGIPVEPGRYLLFKLGSGGTDGQPLPFPDFDLSGLPGPVPLNLNADSGVVALLMPASPSQAGPTVKPTGVAAFVGSGAGATCFEGFDGPAPAPTLASAALRNGDGCSDNNSNAVDFRLGAANPRNGSSPAAPCNFTAPPGFFDFAAPQFDVAEGDGVAHIAVTRLGDVSTPASVEYDVSGGLSANDRSDYTTAAGTLRFAPGEREKSFDVLITDDARPEQNESAFMGLFRAKGAGIGPRNSAMLVIHDNDFPPEGPNPVDDSQFFVRQHYHDFLNREPDAAGLNFWTNNVESCGSDASCREVKRVDTSAAFFLSIEFQNTGFLVYRLYRASLPEVPGRVRSLPRYNEFVRDTQEIGLGVVVGEAGWQQKLELNTLAFLDEFVQRPEFVAAYPASLTPAEYVDRLNAQAGGVLSQSERDLHVGLLTAGLETRAAVLRRVAESGEFTRREINRAFVLMQYFGYLRRSPNDAPDTNFDGFDFWLSKPDSFVGDFPHGA